MPGVGCGRCWLKPAGLKLLLTSNQSKATYWLNKFNWQQQQWHEQQIERERRERMEGKEAERGCYSTVTAGTMTTIR